MFRELLNCRHDKLCPFFFVTTCELQQFGWVVCSRKMIVPFRVMAVVIWKCIVVMAHRKHVWIQHLDLSADTGRAPRNIWIRTAFLREDISGAEKQKGVYVRCYHIWWHRSQTGTYQWRTQEFFFFGGGFNKLGWGQRERGSGGGSPLVRGSGGSCNLVQEISFHIVTFS